MVLLSLCFPTGDTLRPEAQRSDAHGTISSPGWRRSPRQRAGLYLPPKFPSASKAAEKVLKFSTAKNSGRPGVGISTHSLPPIRFRGYPHRFSIVGNTFPPTLGGGGGLSGPSFREAKSAEREGDIPPNQQSLFFFKKTTTKEQQKNTVGMAHHAVPK